MTHVIDIVVIILLCSFWALFLGRTLMLYLRGIKVFTLAKGKPLPERIPELILAPALVLWSLQAAATALGVGLIPGAMFWRSAVISWIGIVLCAGGLILFASALVSFGSSWRVGIDKENGGRLVTSGVFGKTRNPIFLFMDLFFFGIFLVYPNWFFLAFSVCTAFFIHRQILNEEKYLRVKFGREYEEYLNNVGRYL